MKNALTGIALVASVMALAMPAFAGPPSEASNKEIDRMLNLVATYPAMGPTQFYTLKEGEIITVPFMADATIEYYINGIGDDDCANVDLVALEADGTDADTDDADDPSPVLNLHASEYRSPLNTPTGKPERPLTIEIRMVACKTEVCTLGLRIAPFYEAPLAETDERNALIDAASNDGLWDFDFDSNELYLSPRWKAMMGYEDIGPTEIVDWRGMVHPDDLSRVQDAMFKHVSGALPLFDQPSAHAPAALLGTASFASEQDAARRVVVRHVVESAVSIVGAYQAEEAAERHQGVADLAGQLVDRQIFHMADALAAVVEDGRAGDPAGDDQSMLGNFTFGLGHFDFLFLSSAPRPTRDRFGRRFSLPISWLPGRLSLIWVMAAPSGEANAQAGPIDPAERPTEPQGRRSRGRRSRPV